MSEGLILIFSTFSSQNVPQRGIAVDCWQYCYEILRWFVNHLTNIKVLISNFFQLQIELYCEKCLYLLWLHVQGWNKQKVKISLSLSSVFLWTMACQILYSPIFGHNLRLLSWCNWKQALIHPHSDYILTFFFKSRMISTIYHKYSKSFIENILFPASYAIRIYWNNLLI